MEVDRPKHAVDRPKTPYSVIWSHVISRDNHSLVYTDDIDREQIVTQVNTLPDQTQTITIIIQQLPNKCKTAQQI